MLFYWASVWRRDFWCYISFHNVLQTHKRQPLRGTCTVLWCCTLLRLECCWSFWPGIREGQHLGTDYNIVAEHAPCVLRARMVCLVWKSELENPGLNFHSAMKHQGQGCHKWGLQDLFICPWAQQHHHLLSAVELSPLKGWPVWIGLTHTLQILSKFVYLLSYHLHLMNS